MRVRWMRVVLALSVAFVSCSSGNDEGSRDALPDSAVEVGDDVAEGDTGDDPDVDPDLSLPGDAAIDAPADDVPVPDTTIDSPAPQDTPADTAVDVAVDTPSDPGGPVDPKCQALVAGTVKNFVVDGKARSFILNLPTMGAPRTWPVVFNWHGFGDTALNMSMLLSSYVNDAAFPFILVTPEDLNLQPPTGMDWDILKIKDPNPEARLFDEVLECLDQMYGVDWNHVHSVGFSAGAIATDLLGVLRGDVVASLVSFSGTYFSDDANRTALGMLASYISWPALATANPYAQLLIHGSAADNYDLQVVKLQFDANGKRDVGYLNGLGHDVVHCDHGQGHTIPGPLQGAPLVKFLADHPKGAGSPWVSAGLPSNYPAYCEMKPAP